MHGVSNIRPDRDWRRRIEPGCRYGRRNNQGTALRKRAGLNHHDRQSVPAHRWKALCDQLDCHARFIMPELRWCPRRRLDGDSAYRIRVGDRDGGRQFCLSADVYRGEPEQEESTQRCGRQRAYFRRWWDRFVGTVCTLKCAGTADVEKKRYAPYTLTVSATLSTGLRDCCFHTAFSW